MQVHDPAAEGEASPLQVGTMSLVQADVALPNGRGVLHVVDCVMCCLRLLQHCRFEQVWNKTVRPSPKVGLQGDWMPVDELHAVLVHCDTWTPRFTGLRGNVVPLGTAVEAGGNRATRHFQDNTVHYSELLILEKPPEMSKKKRKKPEGEDGSAAVDSGNPTPHYRMMFSLYRRDATPPVPAAPGEEAAPDGKHLTFCMAPEDILIRNSFHMLSESEKESRRSEYKSKQNAPKARTSNGTAQRPLQALTMATLEGEVASPSAPGLEPLRMEALKSHVAIADERIVKLEGISPGMTGGAMALMPDAPLLTALSARTGSQAGGTSIWIQGSRFNTRTRIYMAGQPLARLQVISDGLVTIVSPAAPAGIVEIRATNDGSAWSNALMFTYTAEGEGSAAEMQLMQGQLSLIQQFVQACCGQSPTSEQMVQELMTPALPEAQRLLGAVLALILAGSGGQNHKGGSLDLERQDASGCTLMHYVCGLRNAAALQLLLNSSVDPTIVDGQGQTPADWARRYGFYDGEVLIAKAQGEPIPAPAQMAAATPVAVTTAAVDASLPAVPAAVAMPSGATRSLEQFLEPTAASASGAAPAAAADAPAAATAAAPGAAVDNAGADILTAAAAHLEHA